MEGQGRKGERWTQLVGWGGEWRRLKGEQGVGGE